MKIAALGDSLTNVVSGGASYYPYHLKTCLGKYAPVIAAGVGGNTTADMDTRYATDITPLGAAQVAVLGGVNDLIADRTANAIQTSLASIYAKAVADGAIPVLVTILPWGNQASWTSGREAVRVAVNAWIISRGYPFANVETAMGDLTDPSQPKLKAAYDSGDGLHPNAAGALALGEAVWSGAYSSTCHFKQP